MTSTSPTTPPTPSATDAECLALTRNLRRRGVAVLSVFGLMWAVAAASGTGSATDVAPLAIEVAALLITAAAIYLGYRKDAAPSPRTVDLPANWARGVGIVNTVELAAIFAVIAASNAAGRPEVIPAGIALVVGLHFFPLARLYDQWQYRWTAALLTVVAVAGFVLVAAGVATETVRIVVGLGSAVVLWASSYHLALRG
ncbi:DUF7010 family protein [Streptomyces massasporeus]|uniref:DUF7010 family protein n=1 Tax=Streptomyces massasporeus TaxID=67324 RepID=UPI003702C11E